MSVDPERLARKLKPLMPDRVGRWFRARSTADADIRALLDRQMVSLARAHLGDDREKLLLSLPPAAQARGEIHLGTILYESPKWPLGLSHGELLQNLAILGRSGSGKTNLLFHILHQLDVQRIPFIMFDWKRTGRALLPTLHHRPRVYTPGRAQVPLPFNLFAPAPGMEVGVYVQLLVDTMAEAFTLGDGARSILLKAILQSAQQPGAASVQRVIQTVESMELRHREHGWRASAMRALRGLAMLQIDGSENHGDAVDSLMSGSTIIELDALSHGGKRFLVPMISLWVYQTLLATSERERLALTLAIDEAHHVLYGQVRARETVMEMLLRQCREIGIAAIVLDQNPHLLSAAALGNVFATVCLNQKEPKDVNKAAALSSLDEVEKNWLSRLPVGQAVVRLADRWTQPVLVQVPLAPLAPQAHLAPVDKRGVSDNMLTESAVEGGPGSGRIWGDTRRNGEVPRNPEAEMVIDDGAMALLHDVLSNPDCGVLARYGRLGLAPATGHRLTQRLLTAGWLASATVPEGRSRKRLLALTPVGHDRLGRNESSTPPSRASLVHSYWKRFYADTLRNRGFEVEIEASRMRIGRCDLIARRGDQRLAVEIETGRSNLVANVRRDLLDGHQRVCVVATTASAADHICRQLARAGLLLAQRVVVVVAPNVPHDLGER